MTRTKAKSLLFAAWVSCAILVGAGAAAQDAQMDAPSPGFEEVLATCSTCHGTDGMGNPALNAPRLAGQNERYLAEQMIHFANGLRGQHPDDLIGYTMVPWVAELDEATILELAAHFADYDKPVLVPDPDPSEDTAVSRGMVFFNGNCLACHASPAKGADAIYVPNLAILDGAYLKRQLIAYRNGWRGGEGASTRAAGMRQLAFQFSDERTIDDVVAYLGTAKEVPEE